MKDVRCFFGFHKLDKIIDYQYTKDVSYGEPGIMGIRVLYECSRCKDVINRAYYNCGEPFRRYIAFRYHKESLK